MKQAILFTSALLLSSALFGQSDEVIQELKDKMSQGDYKESFDGYDALIREYGEKEKLLRGRGFSAMYLGKQEIARADYLKALTLNDTCGNCYNNLARVEAIEDNTEKALEYINQAIEINESNGGSYLIRAKIKYQQGAKYGIVSDYNKAVKLEPTAYHHLERANYFAETGNRSQAILDYDEAIRMEPKNAYALSKRGALYLKYDVIDLALEDLKRSISLDSSNAICWANLGEAITMNGDPKTGVEKYNRAIELKPDQMSFYFNRGLTHYSLEEMNLACDDYKKARELAVEQGFNDAVMDIDLAIRELCDPEERSFYYQHGIAMYNKQQFEEAIDTYSAGLEKFPGSVLLTSFRGNAYLAMSQFDLAMADYKTCMGRTSDFQQEIGENPKFGGNPEAIRAQAISGNANVYNCMSEAMLKSGEPKKALDYAELSEQEWIKGGAASVVNEARLSNLFLKGMSHLSMGAFGKSEAQFKEMLKHTPENASIHFLLAYMYLIQDSKDYQAYTRPMVSFNSLLAAGNGVSNQLKWTGAPFEKRKRKEESITKALDEIEKSIALDNQQAEAYILRAVIKKSLNEPGICMDLMQAKELGYNNPEQAIGHQCD